MDDRTAARAALVLSLTAIPIALYAAIAWAAALPAAETATRPGPLARVRAWLNR